MKKFIAITLVLIMALSLFACGEDKSNKDKSPEDAVTFSASDPKDDATDNAESSIPESTTAVDKEHEVTTQLPSATDDPKQENSTPDSTQAPTQKPVTTPTQKPSNNVFRNDTNNAYEVNTVAVKPKYVYWKDGMLHAECFVINGYSHSVHNIFVKKLSLANGDVNIASAEFGLLENVTLAPYTHCVWTFTFPESTITNYGADLSYLLCQYNVTNKY